VVDMRDDGEVTNKLLIVAVFHRRSLA
jgi:hypothetical protein